MPETGGEADPKDRRKKPKAQLTAYDRMQQARAKKHSEKVRAEAALQEVDDEVEKCLEEMYEDFPTAQELMATQPQKPAKEGPTANARAAGEGSRAGGPRS